MIRVATSNQCATWMWSGNFNKCKNIVMFSSRSLSPPPTWVECAFFHKSAFGSGIEFCSQLKKALLEQCREIKGRSVGSRLEGFSNRKGRPFDG